MNSKYLIPVLILLLVGGNALCKTIKVPEDKPNLRAAIKKAKSGDVVLVSPGIYRGRDNKNLVIKKKGITVRSVEGPFNTIIDGEGIERCFDVTRPKFGSNLDRVPTKIEGFTIRNFSVDSTEGGAAIKSKGPIWIQNCIIANNSAGAGGGIFLSGKESSILLYGNTIVENKGGGVYIDPTSVQPNEITLSIFWNNSPYELYSEKKELIAVCNIKDGGTSSGCFEDDPLFADPANGNYRLTSCSPCIDASGLSRKDRDGTATDVGAYSVPYAPCNPADSIRLYAGIDLQTGDSAEVRTDEDYEGELESSITLLRLNDIEASKTLGNTQNRGTMTSEECYEKGREYYHQGNFKKAYAWIRKAAEQGDQDAQEFLWLRHENGKGVRQLGRRALGRKVIAPKCLMIGMSYDEVMATMQVGKESYVIYDWPETATVLACTAFDLAYQCSFPIQFDRFMCQFKRHKGVQRLEGMVFTTEYSSKQEALDNYKQLERYINVSQRVPYSGPAYISGIASAGWWSPSAPTINILLTYEGDKYILRFRYRSYLSHGEPTPVALFP